jgi:hypothetical protein
MKIISVAITQRLEETMAASIGNLTKKLNGNHDIVTVNANE